MISPVEEEVNPVRPPLEGRGAEEEFRDIELECEEEEEAREPHVLRDPGAPSEAEVERHNVTHMPFRSWCPSCVEGKARDKHHRTNEEQDQKSVPEIVFDYGFLGSEGEETIAIQVARDRRTRMLFAHVVPKKGFTHEHGAAEMIKDIAKLGYSEVILKCDGEAALKSIQDEVRKQRAEPTILENSPVGDSRANGAAERAVQALGEQVRVLRRGLEQRLGLKLSGKHPITAWLVEHAADLLSKYQVGDDGRTGYERWKGKPFHGEEIEFGEKVHYRENLKARAKQNKLEIRWGEGFYLGRWWRTGEAVVGTIGGTFRAGTIRRVGAHRRWDREGLEKIRGLPWQWDPGEGEIHADLKVRWLAEDELKDGQAVMTEEGCRMYRLRLKKQDFLTHGFTEGCPGCQAIIAGTTARGHTEACRARMNIALATTDEGRQRRERQETKENEALARMLEEKDVRSSKRARDSSDKALASEASAAGASAGESSSSSTPGPSGSAGAPATTGSRPKRWADQEEDDEENAQFGGQLAKIRRGPQVRRGEKRLQEDPGDDERIGERATTEEQSNHNMDVTNLEENLYQDDMTWTINEVSDMCEPVDPMIRQMMLDMEYFDENTWERLDPSLVEKAELDELARFKLMNVYTYVSRSEAMNDPEGIFVKVKWVRTNKGTTEDPNVKCRLVAQELGYGKRVDELFSGTPSLQAMRLAVLHAAKGGTRRRGIMIMDVKCAFLYGQCSRRIYIELPHRDPRAGDGRVVGRLQRALYGTRDAPQIWAKEVENTMKSLGFIVCLSQPSVFRHVDKDLVVIVHVDDFLCSGDLNELQWLYKSLAEKYELKQSILNKSQEAEVKYLGRTIKWTYDAHGNGHFEIEGDSKHVQLLMGEWGMTNCKHVDTPLSKDGLEAIETGEELSEEEATRARRAIARVNYMAQDRPDLAVVARTMSQQMARPRQGVLPVIKRTIRYLQKFPKCSLTVPNLDESTPVEIAGWTDSNWANDLRTRKSCSGGYITISGLCVSHWSKTQSNIALSSGEAELNAAVKNLSEMLGLRELIMEMHTTADGAVRADGGDVSARSSLLPSLALCVDATACRGMLLRRGSGRVKHLAVKTLWAQSAIDSFSVAVIKVPRHLNAADALTHPVSGTDLSTAVSAMGFCLLPPS